MDDLFCLVGSDVQWCDSVANVGKRLALVDKGDVVDFLGMSFARNVDTSIVSVSQSVSIGNLLERAGMGDCHPAVTPCVAGVVFTKADCPVIPNARPVDMPNYRGLIALANYIAVWTRPDIVWIVNKLCKFMANPGPPHIAALKRLLRYLAGTRDVGLVFKRQLHQPLLKGYTDFSHADCIDSSKSTIAFNMFVWRNPVSWFSHLDCKVYTCTNHAEYCALFTGAKEAVYLSDWLLPLVPVLSFVLNLPGLVVCPVPLLVDNHGAFALSLDPVGRFVNKHVRIEHHFTQQLVADGVIIPVECDTCDNISDIGTKALGPIFFAQHAAKLVGKVLPANPRPLNVCAVFMLHVVPNVTEGASSASVGCQTVDPVVSQGVLPVTVPRDGPLFRGVVHHFRDCPSVVEVFEAKCDVMASGNLANLDNVGIIAVVACSAMRAVFANEVGAIGIPGAPVPVSVPGVPGFVVFPVVAPPAIPRPVARGDRRRRVASFRVSGPVRLSRRIGGRGPLFRGV